MLAMDLIPSLMLKCSRDMGKSIWDRPRTLKSKNWKAQLASLGAVPASICVAQAYTAIFRST